jgi:hypothetical protein
MDNSNKIPVYLFKGKPLQNKFNNDYNRAEKIEIILQFRMTLIMVFYPQYLAKHNHFTINYMVRLWRS